MNGMVTEVKRSSSVPILGLLLLIIVTVIVAVVVGIGVGLLSQLFYLIILMPLGMGAIGGWAIAWAVRQGRVRSGFIALIFGLLVGLGIYGIYRYTEYFMFQQEVRQVARERQSTLTDAQIELAINDQLIEEVGQSGFVGFTLLRAKEGESIKLGRTGSSGTPIKLSTPLTWGYWGIELLVIAGIAAAMGWSAAQDKFCDNDSKFFTTRSLGLVAGANADAFVGAVRANDLNTARNYISRQSSGYPYLEVKVTKCPSCNTNPVELEVFRKVNSKSNESAYLKQTLTPEQFTALEGGSSLPVSPSFA
jgi:hypothetical protein